MQFIFFNPVFFSINLLKIFVKATVLIFIVNLLIKSSDDKPGIRDNSLSNKVWNPSIEVPESKTTTRRWESFDFLWADWDFDFAWASTEELMVIWHDK